jgi:RNA polymerase sigma-70 factor (ECF subfamily)
MDKMSMKKVEKGFADINSCIASIRKAAKNQLKATHADWIDDVTQEVLIKVLEKGSKFDPSKGSFDGWISTITKNHCKDLKNKKDNLLKSELSESHLFLDASDKDLDHRVAKKMVRSSLAQLSELDRQLIVLRFNYDMSGREMASLLGFPENQIPSRLQRAMKRLRLILESGRMVRF